MQTGNFKQASDLLPKTIAKAIGSPPLCDLIKVTGRGAVVRFIEFELIKMRSLITVSGNLNDGQIQFIATQLVEMFPGESLADFKICFERGCIGQYGEIFRMDGIVLRKWMEQYLDEKYQLVEQELYKQPDNIYETHETGPGYEAFKKWAKELTETKTVRPLSSEDIRKEGKENPMRKAAATRGWAYFQVKNLQVLAQSQEHAEELVQKMIKAGEIEEYETPEDEV